MHWCIWCVGVQDICGNLTANSGNLLRGIAIAHRKCAKALFDESGDAIAAVDDQEGMCSTHFMSYYSVIAIHILYIYGC